MPGAGYRHQSNIGYLADFPGARVEENRIAVYLEGADDGVLTTEQADGDIEIEEPLEITATPDTAPLPVEVLAATSTVPVEVTDSAVEMYQKGEQNDVMGEEFTDPDDGPEWVDEPFAILQVGSPRRSDRILGLVESSGQYSATLNFGPEGHSAHSETLADNETGGEATTIDVPAYVPFATLVVTDESGNPDDHTVRAMLHVV